MARFPASRTSSQAPMANSILREGSVFFGCAFGAWGDRLSQDYRLERTAGYFGEGTDTLFGLVHRAPGAPPRDCVAVICPPFGNEYSSSHRTLRHLADLLARHGIPTLRFDYHGTGDSPGTGSEPDRLTRWQSDIKTAIAHARRASGKTSVCLIGVRLGATLAALAASSTDVDLMVLWNPCVSGRAYVRELQALAMTAERPVESAGNELESAGFITSAQTREALLRLDLAREPLRVGKRVLLLWRSDQSANTSLAAHLADLGVAFQEESADGWSGMMAEPHDTEVPASALATIASWVVGNCGSSGQGDRNGAWEMASALTIAAGDLVEENVIEEQPCRFGKDRGLFGIHTQPLAKKIRVAIVMPNAGAQPHFGPNRLYVMVARELASLGIASLRFDLMGLGESVRDEGRENDTYPEWAVADTLAAMDYLAERFGYSRFILAGLCSGAHAAFHAGLQAKDRRVAELVMINPLTYRWTEGMSLTVARDYIDARRYRKSARDPRRWLKLLRGEVAFRTLIRVALTQSTRALLSKLRSLGELALPWTAPQLSMDLRQLRALGRPIRLIISEGDPGAEMLMTGGGRAARRSIRDGDIRLEFIEGADHTFSQLAPRQRLIAYLRERLGPEELHEATPPRPR